MAEDLRRQVPEIEKAELDEIGQVQTPPTDPLFALQYGLHNTGQRIDGQTGTPGADIDALAAWDIATTAPDVILAIIDTGVSQSHPDLAGRLVPGRNFVGSDPASTDDSTYLSHGTACAGVAAATGNNGIGISGVCWSTSIMPVRVANSLGFSSELQCSQGIVWCSDNYARVASLSLGFSSGPDFFADAVAYARSKDVVLVAATGNTPSLPIAFPARFPGVEAVGATDNRDLIAPFTSTGPEMRVVAPGVGIMTTWDTDAQPNDYASETGTSMACPMVAGLACLIRSVNPDLSEEQVRLIIELTAEDLGPPGWDNHYGFGRINARAALEVASGVTPPCPADWDQDGVLNTNDVFRFVDDYLGGAADINRDGITDSSDFFTFLNSFMAGC